MYGQLIVNGLVHPVQHCSHIVRDEWGSCFVFLWSFRWSVVPVLVLLIVALFFILRGDLFYFLPCVILFLCFFSPFSIVITSLGEERANLSAFPTFVWSALLWFCLFPLPLGVWELRFVVVALPGLFSYPFFWCVSYFCSICACLILSVSSSSWCLGRAAVCECGTPLTFLLPFFGAFHTFVWFALVWFCLFPLPLGVLEGLRFVFVALTGLFSYSFWCFSYVCLFCACLILSASSWCLGRATVCYCGTLWTFLLPIFFCPVSVMVCWLFNLVSLLVYDL